MRPVPALEILANLPPGAALMRRLAAAAIAYFLMDGLASGPVGFGD